MKRPGGLVAVGVIAILLGLIGLCGASIGIFGLAMTDRLQTMQDRAIQTMPPSPQTQPMQAMERRMRAATERFKVPNVSIAAIGAVLGSALILGSALMLAWRPPGRAMLLGAFAFGIVYELAAGAFGIYQQFEIQAITREYMQQLTQVSGPNGAPSPGAGQWMNGVMGASLATGLLCGGVWIALKLAAYIGGTIYLRKPEIRSLLQGGGPPPEQQAHI